MKAKITASKLKNACPKKAPFEIHDIDLPGFLVRIEPTGTKTFYLAYQTEEGERKRYRIANAKQLPLPQAREVAKQLLVKTFLGEDIHQDKSRKRARTKAIKEKTLRQFVENKYRPFVEAERKTGTELIKTIYAQFPMLLDVPMKEITAWEIEQWRSKRLKDGKARTTVNRNIAVLKACLTKAEEWEVIEFNPIRKVKPLRTDRSPKVRYLSHEEELSLRKGLDEREERIRKGRDSGNEWRRARNYELLPVINLKGYVDYLKPMVLLLLNTGMRRGEAFHLTWEDVDFQKRLLTVKGDNSKSGQTRYIPLNDEAIKVLKTWKQGTKGQSLVFPGEDGKPLRDVKRAWTTLKRDAGVNNFRLHDLRHHFASRLVMEGVELNTVRELLGHADMTMTVRYAHLSQNHKAEAVAKLRFSY